MHFTVSEVVKFLRFGLSGATEVAARSLARVDFSRKSDGAHEAGHGRESLGKSVEAVVQQSETIPEEFEVRCPVYMNPGLRDLTSVSVRVGIYLDVEGVPRRSSEDARVLLGRVDRAIEWAEQQARVANPSQRREMLELFRRARAIYSEQLAR